MYPAEFLGFVYGEMKASMVNIERMFALMDQQAAITDPRIPARTLPGQDIRLTRCRLPIGPETSVAEGGPVSRLKQGKVAVKVWPNPGLARVHPVKLLFRFYDPQQGRNHL